MKTNYIYLFIIFACAGLLAGYLYSDASYNDYTWEADANFIQKKFKPEVEKPEQVVEEAGEEISKEEAKEVTTSNSNDVMTNKNQNSEAATEKTTDQSQNTPSVAKAYVAGGCFWCVEADAEKLVGVTEAVSGYSGGDQDNPTYENHADHREAVEITYNPQLVSYKDVLLQYMTHHDPSDAGGSFGDRGHSYSSAIYYQTEEEKQIAEELVMELDKTMVFEGPIITSIEKYKTFTKAEEYHQNYYKVNPIRYNGYRYASGRTTFVKNIADKFKSLQENEKMEVQDSGGGTEPWVNYVKPADSVLKSSLSELAYKVTQKEGTEAPYTPGSYDDNHEAGIYVDILSGEPLYSSTKKFDSGTGWPSFTEPISDEFIVKKTDYKLVWPRTEIRSKYGDNHIGHVFTDGPDEAGGLRYCMNGAALLFIPQAEMEEKGYGDYLYLFN